MSEFKQRNWHIRSCEPSKFEFNFIVLRIIDTGMDNSNDPSFFVAAVPCSSWLAVAPSSAAVVAAESSPSVVAVVVAVVRWPSPSWDSAVVVAVGQESAAAEPSSGSEYEAAAEK